ncbi:hypothetical protein ACQ86G_09145 [Roseateles chitinivorans]|uniref:hypothetical protein n=1 Tax=Roseateles chitinivorans TaxID=2917965 RepID=UPI003D671A86
MSNEAALGHFPPHLIPKNPASHDLREAPCRTTLSYVDVDKAEYLRGMAAFYELGSARVIERTFIRAYV